MSDATVLVTGAGGYVGSNVVEYFTGRGFRVVAGVRSKVPERLRRTGASIVQADLSCRGGEEALFSEKVDYVLHVAARASDVGPDEWFRAANYDAVVRLATAALDRGVRRFVYLSTSDVYGLHDFNGEDEDSLQFDDGAANPYPKYKIKSERWLAANVPPERFSCVRPCVVFGRGDTSITPRTIAYLRRSPVVFHFGKWKGRNRWPLAHVENVCRALHAAMVLPEAGGRGVTVLDSRRTTLSEYYRGIAEEFLQGKKLHEYTLPMCLVRPLAWLSTALSRERPIFDPTLYSLDTVAHNLDFSNSRMLAWFAAAGLEEYVQTSYV
jgi:nucleoside-diphosphate-sugar epimerase